MPESTTTRPQSDLALAVVRAIDARRREIDTTRTELADRSGISRATFQRRMAEGNFYMNELAAISMALGLAVDELLFVLAHQGSQIEV